MASFSENGLLKKFEALNPSLQSIQTLSYWIIYHRKYCAQIVALWLREFLATKESKKLTYMYLANDVIQNSKKKGPEFGREFSTVLKQAYEHMHTLNIDEKTRSGLLRILSVWEDRSIYDSKFINELRLTLNPKKATVTKTKSNKRLKTEVTLEVDGKVEKHYTLSPKTPPGDPPEPDEIIKALVDLENNSPSSDAVIRQKISNLPPELSEVSLLSNLEDRATAEVLSSQVDEALILLTEYNNRLSNELIARKKLTDMLKDFMYAQKELLSQAEQRLEEYTEKLEKVYHVRQEMKSHIRNLPDLTQLPDVTGGLAPLPSAGDLFNSH